MASIKPSMFFHDGTHILGRYKEQNNMNKNIALKIRFVLLGDVIVMQVLGVEGKILGYSDSSQLTSMPFVFRQIFETYKSTHLIAVPPTWTQGWSFEILQNQLNEFAEANAFHGKDKPVPRIERNPKSFGHDENLLFHENSQWVVSDLVIDGIEKCIGHKIPIYEGKPKFSHEWKKIYPRELSVEKIKQNLEKDDFDLTHSFLSRVANITNELLSDDSIEIHEFTMWSD